MHDWFAAHYGVLKDFAAPALGAVGLLITFGFGIAGFNTFGKWRREKLEERRIDIAIDALTLAYEARFVFDAIRSRLVHEHEWADAKEESGFRGLVPANLREGQRGPYAVLKRIDNNDAFFQKVEKLEPKFMAVFGAKTEDIFTLIYNSRSRVSGAAEILFDLMRNEIARDDEQGQKELQEGRRAVFGSTDKDYDDKTVNAIRDFRIQIEAICRPIVDRRYKPIRAPKQGS